MHNDCTLDPCSVPERNYPTNEPCMMLAFIDPEKRFSWISAAKRAWEDMLPCLHCASTPTMCAYPHPWSTRLPNLSAKRFNTQGGPLRSESNPIWSWMDLADPTLFMTPTRTRLPSSNRPTKNPTRRTIPADTCQDRDKQIHCDKALHQGKRAFAKLRHSC